MSKQAELFDGTVLEFEDGTPDHVIERVAREQTDRITTEQARKPLPAGVKPSEGRGGVDLGAADKPRTRAQEEGPSRTLADIKSTKKAVDQERTAPLPLPPTPPEDLPGGSVLDKPYEGTIPPRMTDEEYQRNYTSNRKPVEYSPPAGTIQNSPPEVAAGDTIRKATGTSLGGAAVQGIAAGIGGLGGTIPGLVAAGADLVGADRVSEFALGAANRAKNFSDAVTPQGGYGNKLIANVFASTVESLPTLAFGLAGGAEIVGGKAFAGAAAERAKHLAMTELFVQTAGKEYADARNRGVDPGDSAARAAAMGAAEVLGERFGFHEQMAVVRAAFGKKTVPTEQLAKTMATEIFKEIPGEELTTALEFLIDKYGAGGASPKATLADYLEQAMDTAVQTIGQTALMGSPGAVRGTYARADAAIAYDQAALQGFHVTPPYATDPPDTQRKKTIGIFNAAVAQYGIDPEAAKRATEAANSMPAEMVGPFLARMAQALQKRQLVAKPVDEHAIDTLTAGPIDDPKVLEAEAKAAETATEEAKTEPIAASRETTAEEDLTGLSEPSTIDEAAHAAAPSPKNDLPEPTAAQALAGNYQKGHAKIGGLDISIENPEGSTRRDKNNDPPQWESKMTGAHYGYIRGTVSADKEHIDTFIKPGTADAYKGPVFVVDQNHVDGTFDGQKVMLGFDTEAEAKAAYLSNYQAGWNGLRSITPMTMDGFKAWAFDPAKSVLPAVEGDDGGSAKGSRRGARDVQAPAVRDVAERQGSVSQPEESVLPQLRGAGNPAAPRMGGELPGVSDGSGRAPDAAAHVGAQGERRPLPTGQRDLGDQERAGAEHAQEPQADGVGTNAVADSVGRGIENSPNDAAQQGRSRDDGGASRPRVIARAGRMPNSAKPIELRPAGTDGKMLSAWHDGYELVDFETGNPVQVPADATDAQAFEAVKASGAFGKSTKFFDAPKADAAAPTPQATPNTTADAPPAPATAAPAPITPPADSGVKEPEQGKIGGKMAAGQVVRTSSGRSTTPFPKVSVDTERKAQNTVRAVDQWLMANALAEAQARGDDFNARQFEANAKKPSQSDKDSAEEYLFGEQPAVVPSILKPLVDKPAESPVDKAAETQEAVPAKADLPVPPAAFAEALASVPDVFDAPKETVRIEAKAKAAGTISQDAAKAKIEEWRAHALAQGKTNENAGRVVLSLFDTSGEWSAPWHEAGYEVHRFDIQDGVDINDFSVEYLTDTLGLTNVYAIIAAPPCTDFSSSGAHAWQKKDADGRTAASIKLVEQTLNTVDLFKPAIWAMENPTGRLGSVGKDGAGLVKGLPKPRMTFQPSNFGDPYTKRTLLWGDFETGLPLAPVEPTEGSKMTEKLSGSDKFGRSLTPEGFAYSFFMANNAIDLGATAELAREFRGVDRALLQQALDAGMTAQQAKNAIEDAFYDGDIEGANEALKAAMPKLKPPAPPTVPKMAQLSDSEAFSGDYAAFEGKTVEQSVSISDTGGTATLRIDAAKAMRALDARLKVLTELKGCIGRAA